MNQKLWSSLTTALLMTALWPIASGHAAISQAVAKAFEANQTSDFSEGKRKIASLPSSNPKTVQPDAAVEVSQYQPQTSGFSDSTAIAKIYPHILAGRKAATLYVRNIPVLTFLGVSTEAHGRAPVQATSEIKIGETGDRQDTPVKTAANPIQNASKQASIGWHGAKPPQLNQSEANHHQTDDPIGRASAIAAQINQMSQDNLDAKTITVTPDEGDTYLIKINGQVLVAIDAATILPDTTNNRAEDSLQATNRLRRLLGNAEPLQEIPGIPRRTPIPVVSPNPDATDLSFGPIEMSQDGWASWYGPGFDGNYSANGEIFNENDLTAAHRDLPFGTWVRVTNLDNGLSVVVRINDRGPFVEDRIIDLSAAAAETIGMMDSGVAPVRLDIIGSQNTAIAN